MVYSAFSSFYDPKKKLFTSGGAPTLVTLYPHRKTSLLGCLLGLTLPFGKGKKKPSVSAEGGGGGRGPIPGQRSRSPEDGWVLRLVQISQAGVGSGPPASKPGGHPGPPMPTSMEFKAFALSL